MKEARFPKRRNKHSTLHCVNNQEARRFNYLFIIFSPTLNLSLIKYFNPHCQTNIWRANCTKISLRAGDQTSDDVTESSPSE